MRTIKLGHFTLSSESPPVFLAEIGGFFNTDFELARSMINRIIDAGRTVPQQPLILKTEIMYDPEICLPGDTYETYAAKDGRVQRENYRSLIERKVFPLVHYSGLFQICREAKVPFIVSIYDNDGVDFAVDEGVAAIKIASSNIVHIPLIRHAARKGLPILIDTGRASIGEVYRAITVAREAGCEDIVIEHSPDGHPALPRAHNLRILQTYQQAFDLPVGLSDHHVGEEMLYMAIALGAFIVEKGVHVEPEALDIDISHAMGLEQLPDVLLKVYNCWQALGKVARDPNQKIEGTIGTSQRQGLVAKRPLVTGDSVSLDTIRFAFPCKGIPVEHWDLVNGWKLRKEISAGEPVQWEDVCK